MERNVIPGTRNFTIDPYGNVYDYEGNLKNTYKNGDGYITASVLLDDGRWVTFGVQRLVALAYLERTDPLKTEVNHRDGNVENNHVPNLEWVTPSENNIHSELMSTDNKYPRLIIHSYGKPIAVARNFWEAEKLTEMSYLDIWDHFKAKTVTANGTSFSYRFGGRSLPVEFRKRKDRAADKCRIKLKDVTTGEVITFDSFHEAGRHFNVSASHVYQSLQHEGSVKLFMKRYQVAYEEDEFFQYGVLEISIAKGRGPKAVIGYHVQDKRALVTASAKEFITMLNLSKKAITTSLVKKDLRVIDSWMVAYLDDNETVQKLKARMVCPDTV